MVHSQLGKHTVERGAAATGYSKEKPDGLLSQQVTHVGRRRFFALKDEMLGFRPAQKTFIFTCAAIQGGDRVVMPVALAITTWVALSQHGESYVSGDGVVALVIRLSRQMLDQRRPR
jgi:hypothetical protein